MVDLLVAASAACIVAAAFLVSLALGLCTLGLGLLALAAVIWLARQTPSKEQVWRS